MPILSPMRLSKKDEYFVSIAKQGVHTFMMIGVMKDGSPKLFARVGKTSDIDPIISNPLSVIAKLLGNGTLSRMADEGISRSRSSVIPISYQAYSIKYEQIKEFIQLISDVENKQLQKSNIRQNIIRVYRETDTQTEAEILESEAICSYVPTKEDGEEVTFEWKKLKDLPLTSLADKDISSLIEGAQSIHENNTCRTTSLNIVEVILGFVTDVSKYFFIAPKYQTTLDAGQPNKNSFYVLPPPPTVNQKNLTAKQLQILNSLYERIEKIPHLNTDSSETRAKFNAIKAAYMDIIGENHLSASALMQKISEHVNTNKKDLFHQRKPNFFSKLFSISSSTERMFKNIKEDLQKDVEKEEPKKPGKDIPPM